MSQAFHPLLLENLRIHWPGFVLRRVALNQHLAKIERLDEHLHRYFQILVYLRGEGVQHLDGRPIPVRRGSALLIPARSSHRFEKARATRPICLVIDFEAKEKPQWSEAVTLLPRDLAEIERWLVALHGLHRRGSGRTDHYSIGTASYLLRLLDLLQGALSTSSQERIHGPATQLIERLIARGDLTELTPGRLAEEAGRTLDHLNRMLRAEGGTTVGGYLNEAKLERCAELLQKTEQSIGEIAMAIGMADQNYFARWFRRQTGQTPTHWRAAMRDR